MKSFTIRTNGFDEIKKKILLRTLTISILAVAVGLGTAMVNDHQSEGFNFWPYYIVFLGALLAFNTYRNMKKVKTIFNSYRLSISEDGVISREQSNLKPISISAIEISAIEKYKNGSYRIKGLTKTDLIHIPAQIDQVEILEHELNKLHTITVLDSNPLMQQYSLVIVIIILLSMLGVFESDNKVIVSISGIIIIGVMVYGMKELWSNKSIDERVKRRSWIFILVLLAVVYNLLLKVFDFDMLALLSGR